MAGAYALTIFGTIIATGLYPLAGLRPESEGIVVMVGGFLYLIWLYGKKLHEGARKLKEIDEARKKDQQLATQNATKAVSDAEKNLQITLERMNSALKEENTGIRERLAKQEVMSSAFKEQYDKMVLLDQDKNHHIESLIADNAQLKEENSQLKRRLHGKERQRQQQGNQ